MGINSSVFNRNYSLGIHYRSQRKISSTQPLPKRVNDKIRNFDVFGVSDMCDFFCCVFSSHRFAFFKTFWFAECRERFELMLKCRPKFFFSSFYWNTCSMKLFLRFSLITFWLKNANWASWQRCLPLNWKCRMNF